MKRLKHWISLAIISMMVFSKANIQAANGAAYQNSRRSIAQYTPGIVIGAIILASVIIIIAENNHSHS